MCGMHTALIGGLQLHRYIDGMYVKVVLMKHLLQCVCQALLELFGCMFLTIIRSPKLFSIGFFFGPISALPLENVFGYNPGISALQLCNQDKEPDVEFEDHSITSMSSPCSLTLPMHESLGTRLKHVLISHQLITHALNILH